MGKWAVLIRNMENGSCKVFDNNWKIEREEAETIAKEQNEYLHSLGIKDMEYIVIPYEKVKEM